MNERKMPQASERQSFRDCISLVALLFGEAVWLIGSAISLTFEKHLAASSMLLIGGMLSLLSIWTTWSVVNRLRKRCGFPTLRVCLVEQVERKANDHNHPVRGQDNEQQGI